MDLVVTHPSFLPPPPDKGMGKGVVMVMMVVCVLYSTEEEGDKHIRLFGIFMSFIVVIIGHFGRFTIPLISAHITRVHIDSFVNILLFYQLLLLLLCRTVNFISVKYQR